MTKKTINMVQTWKLFQTLRYLKANLSITRSKNQTKFRRGFWYGGPIPEKSGCCAVYLKNTRLAVQGFCKQRNLKKIKEHNIVNK